MSQKDLARAEELVVKLQRDLKEVGRFVLSGCPSCLPTMQCAQ